MTRPMKRYITILWLALTGRNPFLMELDEKMSQLEKADEHISSLNDMYYKALQKWEESARMAEESSKAFEEVSEKLASERQRVHDYEVLIENFRERISEKDTLMDRMKKDYQQRIEQYTKEIEDLQGSYHGGSRKSDRKPL